MQFPLSPPGGFGGSKPTLRSQPLSPFPLPHVPYYRYQVSKTNLPFFVDIRHFLRPRPRFTFPLEGGAEKNSNQSHFFPPGPLEAELVHKPGFFSVLFFLSWWKRRGVVMFYDDRSVRNSLGGFGKNNIHGKESNP